jgi:hypothetical protein
VSVPTIPSPTPIPNGTFSSTGFFYMLNSYHNDCSTPFSTYGVPVDKCIVDAGFAYKFQVAEGAYAMMHACVFCLVI